jgi:hypothetical protein
MVQDERLDAGTLRALQTCGVVTVGDDDRDPRLE